MKIYTVWEDGPDDTEMPCLVASVDEYTVEALDEWPEDYVDARDKNDGVKRRELIIEIPDEAVNRLFRTPIVKAGTP